MFHTFHEMLQIWDFHLAIMRNYDRELKIIVHTFQENI